MAINQEDMELQIAELQQKRVYYINNLWRGELGRDRKPRWLPDLWGLVPAGLPHSVSELKPPLCHGWHDGLLLALSAR